MISIRESERSTLYMYDDDLPVSRIYKIDDGVKIHMYYDGYEFETDSLDTALEMVKIRHNNPVEIVEYE